MSREEESAALRALEWSVTAIAQSAEIQIDLFPAFACAADELALDFDEAFQRVKSLKMQDKIEATAWRELETLDTSLEKISGPERAEYWTDDALRTRVEWEELRGLAKLIAYEMDWSLAPPPKDRSIYVGHDS